MYQRRAVGLLLSIAAIAMVLIALVSRSWFEIDGDDEARLGLRSVEQCTKQWESAGGKCRDQSLGGFFRTSRDAYETPRSWDDDGSWDPRPRPVPEGFILLGTLTLLGGLAAMVAIAATIIIAAAAPRPGPRGLASATALTCGGFVALSVAFVVAAPGSIDHMRAGLGPLLALAGAGYGVAGVLILGRFDPATEPTPAALAVAAGAAPVSRIPMWIAGGIGSVLVLAAIFSQTWFRGRDHDTSLAVGARTVEVCEREIARGAGSFQSMFEEGAGSSGDLICRTNLIPASTEGAEQPRRMRIFLVAGNLTWMTGLSSVLVMLLVGGLAGARQAIGGPLSAPRVLIASAGSFLFCSIVFAMSRPSDVTDVAISYGPFLALAGATALIGAGLMLARWTAAMQLEARRLAAASSDAATPGLPVLGVPTPSPYAAPPPFAPPPPFGAPPPSPFAPPLSPFMPPPPVPSPFSAPFVSSAPVVIIPACPQCATPMLWVSAKSAWLCTICRPTR